MKLLLDTCVWGGAGAELTTAGHDVVHAGNWDHDPGDEAILRYAFEAGRVLVTLDKDFGELAMVRAQPHMGIWASSDWSKSRHANKGWCVIACSSVINTNSPLARSSPRRWRVCGFASPAVTPRAPDNQRNSSHLASAAVNGTKGSRSPGSIAQR